MDDKIVLSASTKMILIWDYESKSLQKVIDDFSSHFYYIEPLNDPTQSGSLVLFDLDDYTMIYKSFDFPETYFAAKQLIQSKFKESKNVNEEWFQRKLVDIFIFHSDYRTSLMHCLTHQGEDKLLKNYLKWYNGGITLDWKGDSAI